VKVLILGGSGLLGRALTCVFAASHTVHCPSHAELDVAQPSQVRAAVEREAPDLVVHSAALADVDRCEQDPEAAWRVNALGAQAVAQACGERDCPLVFISSDYVFDGHQQLPYTEFDETRAVNVYGRTKIAAEAAVRTFCRKHYIVRTTWLFAPWGKNYVTQTLASLRQGETTPAVADQYASPSAAFDVAQGIARLVTAPDYGTYHLVNRGLCSRFEMAQAICRAAGLDEALVKPIASDSVRRPAPRPRFTALRNYRLELQGGDFMRPFAEALAECVNQIGPAPAG